MAKKIIYGFYTTKSQQIMKIPPANIYKHQYINSTGIKSTRNPVELYKMMKMYSKEREEKLPYLKAIIYCFDSMIYNCTMRLIKDDLGNMLAAYTYRMRKNRLEQKSMYIDALVRNRHNNTSKEVMENIYQDMKSIAESKKAEELTLFSMAKEKDLRKKYEKLGFRKDESVDVEGAYVMRAKIGDFLSIFKSGRD